jgi:hypothetical protein
MARELSRLRSCHTVLPGERQDPHFGDFGIVSTAPPTTSRVRRVMSKMTALLLARIQIFERPGLDGRTEL